MQNWQSTGQELEINKIRGNLYRLGGGIETGAEELFTCFNVGTLYITCYYSK